MKKTFSITEALSFGWLTLKSNWKFWVIALLLSFGIKASSGFSYENVFSNNSKQLQTTVNSSTTIPGNSTNGLDYTDQYYENLLNFNNLGSNVLGVSTQDQSNLNRLTRPLLVAAIVGVVVFIATLPLTFLIGLVSVILKMGYINLTLDAARGEQVYYKTLLNQVSLKKAIRLLTAQFLTGLLSVVGLVLFIVPGVIFMLKYSLVSYVIVDQDAKIGEALKKSSELTKGVRTKLLGLFLVYLLLLAVGFLALGYGVIAAMIVISLSSAYVYNELLKQQDNIVSLDQQVESPEPSTLIEVDPMGDNAQEEASQEQSVSEIPPSPVTDATDEDEVLDDVDSE